MLYNIPVVRVLPLFTAPQCLGNAQLQFLLQQATYTIYTGYRGIGALHSELQVIIVAHLLYNWRDVLSFPPGGGLQWCSEKNLCKFLAK